MSADKRIEELVTQSHKTNDPKELHIIATHLQNLGAWNEAAEVRRKAAGITAKLSQVN